MPTGQCNCGSVKVDIPDMPDSSVLCREAVPRTRTVPTICLT